MVRVRARLHGDAEMLSNDCQRSRRLSETHPPLLLMLPAFEGREGDHPRAALKIRFRNEFIGMFDFIVLPIAVCIFFHNDRVKGPVLFRREVRYKTIEFLLV